MKRLEIQTLRRSGHGPSEVGELAGVSPRSVQRIAQEPPIEDPVQAEATRRARMGRPSVVGAFEAQIRDWLAEDPALATGVILERLRREEEYGGGKSAVYELVKQLRGRLPKDGIVRFEAVAGEFSQHDFGQYVVTYLDGTKERIRFFASRLKYSRIIRLRVVFNETTETICHSLVDAFEYFGGVPLISVFDNPKTIVSTREGTDITWQETFAQFCAEVGCVPHVTWPYRPQEKGAAENLVGFGKSNFFKVHRFHDREDLLEKLEEWHVIVNDERPCRATGEIPRLRHTVELPRLRTLEIPKSGFRLRYSRKVRTDGYVEHNALRYYAGMEHVAKIVTLLVGEDDCVIHDGFDVLAEHPRYPLNGKYSILEEQRHELLRKPGARPYMKRQLLLDLCPAGEWLLTELRHRRPELWTEEVDRLFELLTCHGDERLREALIASARAETVGAEYVEAYLEGQVAEEGVR